MVYDIFDFLEKSKDFISPDLIHALRKSSSPIIAELFPVEKSSGKTAGEASRKPDGVMMPHVNGTAYPTPYNPLLQASRKPTVGVMFAKQLGGLVDLLGSCNSHFIR